MGYSGLKELIRAIRSCKTAAEERAVIQKESAFLRTSFKEENVDVRHANVSKLLYIHMLGFPAHFGQIECLKLVAGPRFSDKRLGYLGISLLLDENQETLTLVTNSLKNDMNHSNLHIVGLALGTLGNIASVEVAQDLTDEVEKLMEHSSSYIRKKAALCAIKIINKVPDLHEQYIDKALKLIGDKSHGVMLTGVTLIEELCEISDAMITHFKLAVPILVRRLKSLATTSSFLPELDVNGVTDPFLQVKILKLLRTLGEGDAVTSEAVNDVLAQVATNTDGSKNAGNSILYETVLTIMDIESDSDLKAMAINILGKFLANKDNNTRYVALTTLNKAVTMDLPAVQRHRNTILECLQDPDVSIRRRALDLSFALIDESNIRILTRELLVFLETSDLEFKQDTAIQICAAAERYAPNRRWHIDTIIRVLKLAGNYVNEDIVSGLTSLISQSSDLHSYSVKKLYSTIEQDSSQESLVLSATWTIGEFAHILIQPSEQLPEEDTYSQPSAEDVVSLLEKILNSKLAFGSISVQQYGITALMKLTSRFANLTQTNSLNSRIKSILHPFTKSTDVEVQQRVHEYIKILESGDIRVAVFEPMPASTTNDQSRLSTRAAKKRAAGTQRRKASQSTSNRSNSEVNLLLDLMGDDTPAVAPQPVASSPSSVPASQDLADLLGGIYLSNKAPQSTSSGNVLDLLADVIAPSNHVSPANNSSVMSYSAYDKNGISVQLQPHIDNSAANVVNIKTLFSNNGSYNLSNLSFQVAVPKSQRIQIQPPSTTELSPGSTATQPFRVANPSKAPIRLRIRLSYALNGKEVVDIVEFSGFPENIR